MSKTEVTCNYCNKEFEKPNWQIKQSHLRGCFDFYCSQKCNGNNFKKQILINFEKTGILKCSSCKVEKHYSEFSKSKNKTRGYHNVCKKCMQEYIQKYYNQNREKCIRYAINLHRRYFKAKVKIIKEYLSQRVCCNCGKQDIKTFSLLYITSGEKDINLHKEFGTNTKPERLKQGLEKCKVFCFNCEDKSVVYKRFKIGVNSIIRVAKT